MAANRPIGFWLRLVDGLINEQFDATVEEHGVTRRQWQIMNVLAEAPATARRLADLGAPLGLEQAPPDAPRRARPEPETAERIAAAQT